MPTDWQRSVKRGVLGLVLSPLILAVLYVLVVLNWSFSDGDRVGYLQKFSHKGWLCKTYEGELAMTTVPGVAPVIWSFSVWNEDVAKHVNSLIGKRVVLHYKEYRGIPTNCFGETEYFVDKIDGMPEEPTPASTATLR